MNKPESTTASLRAPSGLHCYGLRDAKGIVAALRREMAADPTTRRSQDPYIRGRRDALAEIEARINRQISDIQAQGSAT